MQQLLLLNTPKKINFFPFVIVIVFILSGFLLFLFEGETNFQNELKILNVVGSDQRNLIDTPGCKILDYEPSPPHLRKYFANDKKKKFPCSNDSALMVTTSKANVLFFYPENIPSANLLNSTMKKILIDLRKSSSVNKSQWTVKRILNNAKVSCCYHSIERVIGRGVFVDNIFKFSKKCYNITEYRTVITKHDAIYVVCQSDKGKGSLSKSYENIHFLVQHKRKNDDKDKSESEILATIRNRLSVIIFGTDSVSRLNFIRTQPKTYQYLTKELGAIEYKGYNKIGDNTFPNIIALLTGNLWTDEFAEKCYRKFVKDARRYSDTFDNCPIIWKDFHTARYTTALLEDMASLATFNFNRLGFRKQPTDHYIRPPFLAAESIGQVGGCLNTRLTHEILLSYSHDFQVTYKNDLTFSHVWATALTHNDMNQGVYADEPNLKYLKSLKEDGIFNKTILFFISDHGIRFGKFRETDWGRYEENLPYLFIVVPEWFHERFPIASRNLQENSLKLSTPLDLHETLKDILYEKYSDKNHVLKNSSDKDGRISLFQSLPITRTCTDIGMPLQYCACQNYVQMEDTDGIFEKIAYHLLLHLNKILIYFPDCAQVKRLEVKRAFKTLDEATYSGIVGHFVTVQASYEPGNALIETALIWEKTNKNFSFIVFGEISRINRYGDQSKCVTDSEMAKICVCKDRI